MKHSVKHCKDDENRDENRGLVRVDIDRLSDEDEYVLSIDNVSTGEIIRALSVVVNAVKDGSGYPLEDILASLYNTCLTPEELDRLQDEVDKHNREIEQMIDVMKGKGVVDVVAPNKE